MGRGRRAKPTTAGGAGAGAGGKQSPSVAQVGVRRLSPTQRARKAASALELPLLARLVQQPAPGVAHWGQLRGAVPMAAGGAGRAQVLPVGGAVPSAHAVRPQLARQVLLAHTGAVHLSSLTHARAVAEQRVRVRERGALVRQGDARDARNASMN